ncbi:hypothetical protein SAMN05216334_10739 [Nitrosomonas ureae]|uniref:Uncharacterized protein n=1 Tax=Nitrosomonas ureae TaxID=44577 RepID=A0A1H5UC48_9PROT|nr:hypothetical protein SAMN05216334_10739 [Nitrosomonas ureae]
MPYLIKVDKSTDSGLIEISNICWTFIVYSQVRGIIFSVPAKFLEYNPKFTEIPFTFASHRLVKAHMIARIFHRALAKDRSPL